MPPNKETHDSGESWCPNAGPRRTWRLGGLHEIRMLAQPQVFLPELGCEHLPHRLWHGWQAGQRVVDAQTPRMM